MIDTFSEIRAEINYRGFDYVPAARVNTLINHYYFDVCHREAWPFLEATASGTAPLTVADFGHALSIVDTTGVASLTWEDFRSIRERDPALSATGSPEVWYWDAPNTQIEVYPANTTNTISVFYQKVPTALSADSDEPLIPSRFRYVLVEGVVSRLYRDDDEFDAAERSAGEYETGIVLMTNELMLPNYDSAADLASGPPGTGSTDW